MSDLPAHSSDQAYCVVSALEAGFVDLPLDYLIDTAKAGERQKIPSLSFLLRHTKNNDTLVFDLGIRKDLQSFTPEYLERIRQMTFICTVPKDAVDSLAQGGLAPTDIKHVCVSHIHFDHIGDPVHFPTSTFLVGAGAQPLIENGYPHDPKSLYHSSLFPRERTRYLDPSDWPPLGPFPHAFDFYGDGSVYIVDAGSGHVAGHINVLARTSPDGGWIYLAGDSAHDRRLLTGEAQIPKHDVWGCAHRDKEAAALHIARIRTLMETHARVRVLLAHDVPWYELSKGGNGFWPGTIHSL